MSSRGEHHIADDAAGFAGAADVGDPVEFGIGMFGLPSRFFMALNAPKTARRFSRE